MNQVRELRAVLIGGRQLGGKEASGKSSVGNTILGREAFPTDRRTGHCQKAEGVVHGINVTLVDTPGWWWHYSVENTPSFDKLEIMQSMSLCLPGPHVFLLVLPVDSVFPEIYKIALMEHLEGFGKQVWNHTIVVFSSIAPINMDSFKKHVKKCPDLNWLLKKCRNNFHVLDVKNPGDGTQIYALLCKLAEMVTNNNGHYYKINTQLYTEMIERRKRAKEKAQQRISAVQRQRDELKAKMLSGVHPPPDTRLVIVGASWAARSSAGNLFLGTEAFNVDEARTTVRCEIKYNEIHGRQLTVVDTPGWYYNSPLKTTSETDKLEIKRSVTLCPPGPQAFLLTVPTATAFNRAYKQAVEEHMSLFGEEVWDHTIVLFTRGDWLGDTTIEERIETDEPYLEWLMSKCKNRYHVLTCKTWSDVSQTAELIEKIDEMVAGNQGGHYETDSSFSTELHENQMAIQSRAKTNRMKARKQINILRELFKGENDNLSHLRIVLLGKKKSGKSSSGNTILSDMFFQTRFMDLQNLSPRKQCIMHQNTVAGYHIEIVDTPGWSVTSEENTKQILNSVSLCPPGPDAVLLVLSARETFTNEDRQVLEEILTPFGERVWKHTLLLFSHEDWLKDKPIEVYIECEGDPLKWLVNKCESRYHTLQNYDSGDQSQVKILLDSIKDMVVRNKRQPFIAEETKGFWIQKWFSSPKTLTEEEWNKREEELIQKMLKAVQMEFHADDSTFPPRQRSGVHSIETPPNMSAETMSDIESCCTMRPHSKVSEWLKKGPHWNDSSSGYGTECTAISSNDNI